LFLKFRQNAKVLFLERDLTLDIDPKQKYHIVLSPSLYWVKKEKLPVKYLHEVKKLAPTLFEETLPEGNYNYFAYKEGDDFLLFAYEDKDILTLLGEKGISLHQVKAISFAQSVLKDIQEPVRINAEYVLTQKEGIVVLLPAAWFGDAKALEEVTLQPSKHTIQLEQFSHLVDKKTLYKAVILLSLFAAVLFGEYSYFNREKKAISLQKEKLFQEYKLKPTLMQNSAILARYKKDDQKQQHLREYIAYFLKARLQKGEKILSIEYDGKALRIVMQGVSQREEKRLLSGLYKQKVTLKTRYKADKLIVEVAV